MRLTGDALEQELERAATRLTVKPADWITLKAFTAPLRCKNEVTRAHYEHSGRVALSASRIGDFVHLDPRALFFAGLTHDLGKCLIPTSVLGKTDSWTKSDARTMRRHVTLSYEMLRDRFSFTAAVVLWHHRFQKDGYPKVLPKAMWGFSEATKLLVMECGRMLAIADVYDAMHRTNSATGGCTLSEAEIKGRMLGINPDRVKLVADLYDEGILGNG